jgi:hypothetical protein
MNYSLQVNNSNHGGFANVWVKSDKYMWMKSVLVTISPPKGNINTATVAATATTANNNNNDNNSENNNNIKVVPVLN